MIWIPPVYTEKPGRFYQARWLSHPLMALGHHQPRIYRMVRPTLRDFGEESTARFFWVVDGQLLDEDYLVDGAQYADTSSESREAGGSRLGRGTDKMTAVVSNWNALRLYFGVKVYVGILNVAAGTTRVYELTEGAHWTAAVSDEATAISLNNAIAALDGVGYDSGLGTDTITWEADYGYLLTFFGVSEPLGVTPVLGLVTTLSTPDGGVEFDGDARFMAGVGESDVQQRIPVSGRMRGRRFQIGMQNTPAQRLFGLRSFEIDTRRTDGRR
jgi:hypothetical protein